MKFKSILLLLTIITIASCSSDDDTQNDPQNNCETPFGLAVSSVDISSVEITWTQLADITSYQVEYGVSGFSTGSGTTMNVFTNQAQISNLMPGTSYDFYVRSNCSAQSISTYSVSVTATTDDCPIPTGMFINNIGDMYADIGWDYIMHDFVVEYGPSGFTPGTGTTVETANSDISLNNLSPDTAYDVYVRVKCGTTLGDYSSVLQFTTFPICRVPESFRLDGVSSTWITVEWTDYWGSFWEVEYGAPGFPLGTGTVLQTDQMGYFVNGLTPNTTYEFYVRSNCGSDGYSEYSDPLTATTNP